MRPRHILPKTVVDDEIDSEGCANVMRLVAVVGGLVGAVGGDVEVLGLDVREGRELDVERLQVGTGDLLVELLGKHVDTERELLGGSPESNLSEDLVGERAGHDEGGVASGASKVDETALSEEDDVTTISHGEAVDLGLHVDNLLSVRLQPSDIDLNIEMTDAVTRIRWMLDNAVE